MDFFSVSKHDDVESSRVTGASTPYLTTANLEQSFVDSSANSPDDNSFDVTSYSTSHNTINELPTSKNLPYLQQQSFSSSNNSNDTHTNKEHPPLLEILTSATENDPSKKSDAEIEYIKSGMSLAKLCTLSMGLVNNDGSPLLDPMAQPWCSVKNKKSIKPSALLILDEIQRRSNKCFANNDEVPKPTFWDKPRKLQWLHDNPTKYTQEVAFLQNEVLRIKNCFLKSILKN